MGLEKQIDRKWYKNFKQIPFDEDHKEVDLNRDFVTYLNDDVKYIDHLFQSRVTWVLET